MLKHYQPPTDTRFVLDGGALLHRVKWLLRVTYSDIVAQYLSYLKARYRSSSIIFAGYAGPYIKYREHQPRAARTSANIQIEDGLEIAVHQELK